MWVGREPGTSGGYEWRWAVQSGFGEFGSGVHTLRRHTEGRGSGDEARGVIDPHPPAARIGWDLGGIGWDLGEIGWDPGGIRVGSGWDPDGIGWDRMGSRVRSDGSRVRSDGIRVRSGTAFLGSHRGKATSAAMGRCSAAAPRANTMYATVPSMNGAVRFRL